MQWVLRITPAVRAAFLIDVIRQRKGEPLDRLIVKDLRALAESPLPTKRFFGRFIAALGRNAVSHEPYDLLGADADLGLAAAIIGQPSLVNRPF